MLTKKEKALLENAADLLEKLHHKGAEQVRRLARLILIADDTTFHGRSDRDRFQLVPKEIQLLGWDKYTDDEGVEVHEIRVKRHKV